MKISFASIAFAVAAVVVAANHAAARVKHPKPRCVDQPYQFSWNFLIPGQAVPQPNGCSPAVYQYGKYVGQDPDPSIRFQLLRDPATGYSAVNNN